MLQRGIFCVNCSGLLPGLLVFDILSWTRMYYDQDSELTTIYGRTKYAYVKGQDASTDTCNCARIFCWYVSFPYPRISSSTIHCKWRPLAGLQCTYTARLVVLRPMTLESNARHEPTYRYEHVALPVLRTSLNGWTAAACYHDVFDLRTQRSSSVSSAISCSDGDTLSIVRACKGYT